MTTWTEETDASSTWTEHTTVVPVGGAEAVEAGDEWHDLWTAGYDFTPWSREGESQSTWTEG